MRSIVRQRARPLEGQHPAVRQDDDVFEARRFDDRRDEVFQIAPQQRLPSRRDDAGHAVAGAGKRRGTLEVEPYQAVFDSRRCGDALVIEEGDGTTSALIEGAGTTLVISGDYALNDFAELADSLEAE